MRDYAKVAPTFWTGKTGKEIKRRGIEAVIVAVYLMSSPHSNMLGLYYQPKLYMAHETGLGIEGASKGLQGCVEAGFCAFDEPTEMVWVLEMAAYQIAQSLSQGDKRCKGIQKDYDALPSCPFLSAFFDRYARAFHLSRRRDVTAADEQAPSKPHRSQEQEQEQEQEQDEMRVKRATRKPFDAAGIRLPDWLDSEAWSEWVADRRERRKAITERAAEQQLRKLAEYRAAGHDPVAVIRHSIANGYQGLYPEKAASPSSRTRQPVLHADDTFGEAA